jgi:Protein kinase domain/AAA ATPase domain
LRGKPPLAVTENLRRFVNDFEAIPAADCGTKPLSKGMTASPPPPADRFAAVPSLPLEASDTRTARLARSTQTRRQPRPPKRGSRREIVVENARTRIIRIHLLDGRGSLICKECLGPDGSARAQREIRILEHLAGLTGVPVLSQSSFPSWMVALQDCGDATLATALKRPITPDHVVALAHQLALILGGIHRRGITHRDINPTNIILKGPDDPILIDFDLASGSDEVTPSAQYREIAGMLAYLAPEQTGRMGWPVDQRADLYALGVILYQALTGCVPFPSDDPLEVIRGHLTRVPDVPAVLNPRVEPILSEIVMRLLAKAPDRRYQSAEGLAYDLARLLDSPRARAATQFPLGLRDFPQRIAAPARLIGREKELAFLRAEFEAATKGDFRFVVVAGPPGVGKTALVEALRSIVVARRAWFVSAKYSRLAGARQSSNGVPLCRALMQLVLAEAEPEITEIRQRIATSLGPKARVLANLVPELATLLDIEPGPLPPDHGERRALVGASLADCFRAVAVPGRPVVSFSENLQWASPAAIAAFNAFLADERVRSFLLIASYQEGEGEGDPAASTILARLLQGRGERRMLRLGNLPAADIGTMLSDMLRLPGPDANRLASAIHARTGGNPFHALELTNALRREGLLSPDLDGWRWDEGCIRWHAEEENITDLLHARLSSLPQSTQSLLAIMACLGREAEYDLLRVASDLDDNRLSEALVPALEDGLLVAGSIALSFAETKRTIRFRYEMCHEAAYRTLAPEHQSALHLTIAGRLAGAKRHRNKAAEQYLAAIDLIRCRDDRAEIALLLRDGASEASNAGLAQSAEPFLAASVALLDPPPPQVSPVTLAAVEREWHQCLAFLGRRAEADRVYASLVRRCHDPIDLVDATAARIALLYRQGFQREAVALGVDLMVKLGASRPGPDLEAGIAEKLDQFYAWAAAGYPGPPTAPPDDPYLLAIAKLLSRTLIAAFHCDHAMTAWIMLEAQRLWTLAGPSLPLVACLSIAPHVLASLQEDYRTGYKLGLHLLAVAEAHNYDTAAPAVRHRFAVYAAHWFEPLEDCARHAELAREGLIGLGDLQLACLSYHTSMVARLESSERVDDAAAEIDKLMSLARSTGDSYAELFFQSFADLISALQGAAGAEALAPDHQFEPAEFAHTPTAAAFHHIARSLQAALFDDFTILKLHLERAWSLVPHVQGCYLVALVHLLKALAIADTLRSEAVSEHAAKLTELDAHYKWLELRAIDNPASFRHLAHLVAAERAWVLGDTWAALSLFELAFATRGTATARMASSLHLRKNRSIPVSDWNALQRALAVAGGAPALQRLGRRQQSSAPRATRSHPSQQHRRPTRCQQRFFVRPDRSPGYSPSFPGIELRDEPAQAAVPS